MKRTVAILTVLLALGMAFGVSTAKADNATITITVMIQSLGVSVTPGNYDFGAIILNGSKTTWTSSIPANGGHFTVSNTGNVDENLDISVNNSTNWTAAGTAGADTFALGFGQTEVQGTAPAYTNIPNSSTGSVNLTSGLASAGTYSFDLEFQAPATTTSYDQQSITVNIAASPS
jgi:hypothetical protein